jgi:hypothetical protein
MKVLHTQTFNLSRPGRLEVIYLETRDPLNVRETQGEYYVDFPSRGALALTREEFKHHLSTNDLTMLSETA